MKKLTFPELIVLLAISLMLVSISGKILMNYPFLILDKNNLNFIEKDGWVRYVKTTGKYSGETLWFSEGENKEQIKLVCIEKGSNYVSSNNCKLSSELAKEITSNKNYTKWKSAKVTIAEINIPVVNLIFNQAILIEK